MVFKEICLILGDSEFLKKEDSTSRKFEGIDQQTFAIPFYSTIQGNFRFYFLVLALVSSHTQSYKYIDQRGILLLLAFSGWRDSQQTRKVN